MLSIIITSLNEKPQILNQTIRSILDTSPEDIEIIVIDDCSDTPVNLEYKGKNIKFERNKFRIGVAQSRHIGATLASKKWLLFTDAHMKFKHDWYNNFIEYQKLSTDKTIYNGTCLGLWEGEFEKELDLEKLPKYCGARLSLHEEKENQILEGKWTGVKNEDYYPISCLMGAIYFIRKNYFFNLRGLSDLRMWGSDEPCLSLKTLLSGGEIIQLKNVKVAHLFRGEAPYRTANKWMVYNKIRMAKTLLPDDMGELLISKLPKDRILEETWPEIEKDRGEILEYKNYYKSIFNKDIKEICEKYKIKI